LGDDYILIPQDFGMIPFRVFGHRLYTKKKLLQYQGIVGVVFSLSGFVQLLGDPPGAHLFDVSY
ncbi:hypothetical protein, partial [Parabacteroides johnsonii]